MKYKDFSDMLQKMVNDLPMIFAFSNEQLDNALDDMGLSLKDMKGDKLIRMGFGAFCLKSDLEHIRSELCKVDEMKRDLIKDYEHAYDGFFYETGKHEYHIRLALAEVFPESGLQLRYICVYHSCKLGREGNSKKGT